MEAAYHHGALREALLAAADALLRENGVAALTLRAIARRAGVSHGAPAHHFRDLPALLSELAARGFAELVGRLEAADRSAVRFPIVRAYVRFATENPALFSLMFRDERLDPDYVALRKARRKALALLSQTQRTGPDRPDLAGLGAMAAAWSLAHGFAVLAIDQRLTALLAAAPPETKLDDLLEAALTAVNPASDRLGRGWGP